jgi:alkyl hydroperoxide reductase subunit AhpC
MRNVARKYGVLNEERGIANRTTFIVDTNGIIRSIVEGGDAIDWSLSLEACTRLDT